MREKKKKVPGPDFPSVPGHDELRPNQRDADPARGALAYARPHHTVMDLGAPRITPPDPSVQSSDMSGGQQGVTTATPASTQFTPGWVEPPKDPGEVERRIAMQPGFKRGGAP